MSYVTVKNGRLNDYYFTGFLYIVYEEFARIELNFLPPYLGRSLRKFRGI